MGINSLAPTNALSVIRGTSLTMELTVTDETTSARVDLTGGRVILSVKEDTDDVKPIIQKDSVNGISEVEFTNPLSGVVRIYLNPLDTQSQAPGRYVFDVWAVLASGQRYAVVETSLFEILPGVTILP